MVISFRKGLSCPPEHEAQTEKYGVRKRERDRARKTETELRNRGREGGRETERERGCVLKISFERPGTAILENRVSILDFSVL